MKHLVAIVDSHPQHAKLYAQVLSEPYEVELHDSTGSAIRSFSVRRPKVLLVGQNVGTNSGVSFLRDLRKEKLLPEIAPLFMLDSHDFRLVDTLRELGVKDLLLKPFPKSVLLQSVSDKINGRIQETWQDLSVVERKALQGSLRAFDAIADDIANDNPITFKETADACSAVVELVAKGELNNWLKLIRDHDNFTYVHSLRFATYMALFGKSIGLPKDMQNVLASGGLLHDIGMMRIPRNILNKQEKLGSAEIAMIRDHVNSSNLILARSENIPKGVLTVVANHHERLDGSGYPVKRDKSELNDLARMAGIVDVFCGLTDRRPYKRSLPPHVALELIATDMKSQLDVSLLVKFKEILLDSIESDEPTEELIST